jgi:hypothetical protein
VESALVIVLIGPCCKLLRFAPVEVCKRQRPRPAKPLRLISGRIETLGLLRRRNIRVVLTLLLFEAAFGMCTFNFVATHLRESFHLDYEHIGALITLNALGALTYFSCAPFLLRKIGQLGIVPMGRGSAGPIQCRCGHVGQLVPSYRCHLCHRCWAVHVAQHDADICDPDGPGQPRPWHVSLRRGFVSLADGGRATDRFLLSPLRRDLRLHSRHSRPTCSGDRHADADKGERVKGAGISVLNVDGDLITLGYLRLPVALADRQWDHGKDGVGRTGSICRGPIISRMVSSHPLTPIQTLNTRLFCQPRERLHAYRTEH